MSVSSDYFQVMNHFLFVLFTTTVVAIKICMVYNEKSLKLSKPNKTNLQAV